MGLNDKKLKSEIEGIEDLVQRPSPRGQGQEAAGGGEEAPIDTIPDGRDSSRGVNYMQATSSPGGRGPPLTVDAATSSQLIFHNNTNTAMWESEESEEEGGEEGGEEINPPRAAQRHLAIVEVESDSDLSSDDEPAKEVAGPLRSDN